MTRIAPLKLSLLMAKRRLLSMRSRISSLVMKLLMVSNSCGQYESFRDANAMALDGRLPLPYRTRQDSLPLWLFKVSWFPQLVPHVHEHAYRAQEHFVKIIITTFAPLGYLLSFSLSLCLPLPHILSGVAYHS